MDGIEDVYEDQVTFSWVAHFGGLSKYEIRHLEVELDASSTSPEAVLFKQTKFYTDKFIFKYIYNLYNNNNNDNLKHTPRS